MGRLPASPGAHSYWPDTMLSADHGPVDTVLMTLDQQANLPLEPKPYREVERADTGEAPRSVDELKLALELVVDPLERGRGASPITNLAEVRWWLRFNEKAKADPTPLLCELVPYIVFVGVWLSITRLHALTWKPFLWRDVGTR